MNIWNEAIWKEINDEVRKVAGTIRVAQKVFPTIIVDNPDNIPNDKFDLKTFTIAEGSTKPLVEVSAQFVLTPNQVAHEGSLHTGLKLAKLRASDLAQSEDLILFQGLDAKPALAADVQVRNLDSAKRGLLGLATIKPIDVKPLNPAQPGVIYGANTFNAVVLGITQLNAQSQPGPFALILEYSVFADTYSALAPSLTTTADRIIPLVTGGFLGTAALPSKTGLLVSLGGEPTTIYMGVEATTAFTRVNDEDNHYLRVFERVQFNARDPRAFVRLNFAPVILKLVPNSGPVKTETEITIEGIGFNDATSMQFGQVPLQPGDLVTGKFKIVDDTHIKLLTPKNANAIAVDVTVAITVGGRDLTSNSVQFTYKT